MSSGRRRCNSGPRRTRRTSGSRPSWRFAARAAGGKELQEDVQQKNEKQEGIQRGGGAGGGGGPGAPKAVWASSAAAGPIIISRKFLTVLTIFDILDRFHFGVFFPLFFFHERWDKCRHVGEMALGKSNFRLLFDPRSSPVLGKGPWPGFHIRRVSQLEGGGYPPP